MASNVYFQAFKTSLLTKLEYRSDFFMGVGAALGLQAAALGTLWVVLNQTPSLVGWSGTQVVLLFGLTAMIQSFSELFFNNVWNIPTYIVRGQIDRLLVYPVKSLPFFLVTSPELHAFGNFSGGAIMFCYAAHALHLPFAVFALVPLWVICGSFVHTSFLVFCCALSFRFMGQKGQHFWVVNALLMSTRYPVGIYPNAFKFLVLFLVPMAASNFLPVGWILGSSSLFLALAAPLLAAGLSAWMAFKVWAWGLKRYESTGS